MSFGTEIYDFITDTNNEDSVNEQSRSSIKSTVSITFAH